MGLFVRAELYRLQQSGLKLQHNWAIYEFEAKHPFPISLKTPHLCVFLYNHS